MRRLYRVLFCFLLASGLSVSAHSQEYFATAGQAPALMPPDASSAFKTKIIAFGAPPVARPSFLQLAAQLNSAGASSAASDEVAPPQPVRNTGNKWVYRGLHAALFASTMVSTEALMNCPKCSSVPPSLHTRTFLYGAEMPFNVGIVYLGHYLHNKGHRWWFVPAIAATAANSAVGYHWASEIR